MARKDGSAPGPSRQLLNFADLHVGVDGEIRVADGRSLGGRGVAGGDAEIVSRTFDQVRISFAPGVRHGKGARGNQLFERNTTSIEGDVTTLRLGDLQQIGAHGGERDGLGRRGAFIRDGHGAEGVVVNAKDQGSDENYKKGFHRAIFGGAGRWCKAIRDGRAEAGKAWFFRQVPLAARGLCAASGGTRRQLLPRQSCREWTKDAGLKLTLRRPSSNNDR
jgi:hypothetical protein